MDFSAGFFSLGGVRESLRAVIARPRLRRANRRGRVTHRRPEKSLKTAQTAQ